jgi:hypothetical protein
MMKINLRRTPMGVLLIAGFYLFGAVVLLVSMFTNPVEVSRTIADAHGLPPALDTLILPVVAILAILMAYGLVTVSRWGFFLTAIYLVAFGLINLWLMVGNMQQPYIGNTTWCLLTLVYLIAKRNVFLKIA